MFVIAKQSEIIQVLTKRRMNGNRDILTDMKYHTAVTLNELELLVYISKP